MKRLLLALLLSSSPAFAQVMVWPPTANYTLTDNGCTVTEIAGTGYVALLTSTALPASGKLYFEIRANSNFDISAGPGLTDSSGTTNYWFRTANGLNQLYGNVGTIISPTLPRTGGGDWFPPARIQVAVDMGAKKSWEHVAGGIDTAGLWNNNPGEDPATGTGGLDLSAMSPVTPWARMGDAGESYTIFSGSLDQTETVPAGFTAVTPGGSCFPPTFSGGVVNDE